MKTKKEKLFSGYVEKWVKKTWLGWWTIKIKYYNSYENFKERGLSDDSLAVCHTNWKYMYATIRVNTDKLEEQKKEDIELIVLHELMHIFLNEMRADEEDDTREHEERVATVLAESFLLAGSNND